MATSGYISVPATYTSSGAVADTLKFSWQENSQSVADNETTVGWKLELIAGQYGKISSTASKKWSVIFNGNSYSGTNTIGIANNATKTLASGTTVIPHNADGTKTFSFSFSQELKITFNSYVGTKTGSGTGTLDTIPRASQPSCVTYPNHTQNVGNFGDTISIHMNRNSSSFTHTVRYQFGTQSGTIATGVGTGTTWTIPMSLMNLIPSTTSGSGTIYVDTYNGSSLVGTKSCGFTATVPNDVAPTVSVTLEDITGIDDIYGKPVQGLSKIKITATATPAYSSPIKHYQYVIDGKATTSYDGVFTSEVLSGVGSLPVVVNVADGREHTGSWDYTMTVLPYSKPSVDNISVHRCDANGNEDIYGSRVKVTFSASVSSMSDINTATYAIWYKKTSASAYTKQTLTDLANNFSPTDQSFVFAADEDSAYDVAVVVTDRHWNRSRETSVSTAFSLQNYHKDGTGLCFGGIAEDSKTFKNNLSLRQVGNRYTMSSPGTANSNGYVRMASITITAANADTPITFVFTQRRAIAPMTVYVCLRNADMEESSLQGIVYEGENYGAFLVKADTMTWDLYVQKSSNWDTITLQDWWSSKTMEARMTITFPGDLISSLPATYYRATPAKLQSLLDHIFPVGSIYIAHSHTSPASLFGGTWIRLENTFLWACDAAGQIGGTGGAKEVTLTAAEMPRHYHTVSVSEILSGSAEAHNKIRYSNENTAYNGSLPTNYAGGNSDDGTTAAHNNMPPYTQVSAWWRKA